MRCRWLLPLLRCPSHIKHSKFDDSSSLFLLLFWGRGVWGATLERSGERWCFSPIFSTADQGTLTHGTRELRLSNLLCSVSGGETLHRRLFPGLFVLQPGFAGAGQSVNCEQRLSRLPHPFNEGFVKLSSGIAP